MLSENSDKSSLAVETMGGQVFLVQVEERDTASQVKQKIEVLRGFGPLSGVVVRLGDGDGSGLF